MKLLIDDTNLDKIKASCSYYPVDGVTTTPMQAFLATKAGADYAAPYGNRIDGLGADGVRTAETIQGIFTANGL